MKRNAFQWKLVVLKTHKFDRAENVWLSTSNCYLVFCKAPTAVGQWHQKIDLVLIQELLKENVSCHVFTQHFHHCMWRRCLIAIEFSNSPTKFLCFLKYQILATKMKKKNSILYRNNLVLQDLRDWSDFPAVQIQINRQ